MSIFDSLKKTAESTLKKEAAKAVNNAAQSVGKGKNRSESFTFTSDECCRAAGFAGGFFGFRFQNNGVDDCRSVPL